MDTKSTRSRGAAALVASLAMLGSAASVTTSPAQSAAVEGDCTAPYPMAEFGALVDTSVQTLTVVRGTTPVEFTGTILGKIDSGIAPGVDMIMADFGTAADDTRIDEVGIWQGMSGSPVYAEDGRLIGAVAYGLAWGPSPVAGITPYEKMDDYLAAAPAGTVEVSDKSARQIAAATDVSRAQASEGFSQLPMAMGFSGLSEQRIKQMKKKGPDYLHTRGMRSMGAASSSVDAGPEDLVAGGNLGAAISYGDITAGGVGTVTSVCDDRLVGFGHPMTYGGRTTLGMMPADAVYVQEDPVGPGFKVANMGAPAGTIDQDRLTGISGSLGVMPPETDVSSEVTYGSRFRDGDTASLVPEYNADITFSQILANHDVVVDAIQPGSEMATFSVIGTDADDQPFEVAFDERYTSEWDISFESIWDIADIVWILSSMEDVTITSVDATADVTDEVSMYRVRKIEQKRGGEWVVVNRRKPVVATPGSPVKVRTTIESLDSTVVVPMSLPVPNQTRRGGYLVVEGGASSWDSSIYDAETPAEMVEAVDNMVGNDELVARLDVARRGSDQVSTVTSEPQDLVVRGGKYVPVRVRR
jgi:hypothetical protein